MPKYVAIKREPRSPKSPDELIAMAREVNAEFGKLHAYMGAILREPK